MLYRTLFRSALASGAVIGLNFLFPVLLPLYITAAVIGVLGSLAVTKNKIDREAYLDSVPAGDLEYYKQPKANLLEKLENLIAYPFVALVEKIEDAIDNSRNNKTKTDNTHNKSEILSEENFNALENYTIKSQNKTAAPQEKSEKKIFNTEEKAKDSSRTL